MKRNEEDEIKLIKIGYRLVTQHDGIVVRNKIESRLAADSESVIVLNFENVEFVSNLFADESYAVLLLKYDKEVIQKRVQLINTTSRVRMAMAMATEERLGVARPSKTVQKVITDNVKLPPHLRNAPSKFGYLKKAYEPEPDPNEPKQLGLMNSWYDKNTKTTNYPDEYKFCIRKRPKNPHKPIEKSLGRCYSEFYCPKCNIKWTVDSSD